MDYTNKFDDEMKFIIAASTFDMQSSLKKQFSTINSIIASDYENSNPGLPIDTKTMFREHREFFQNLEGNDMSLSLTDPEILDCKKKYGLHVNDTVYKFQMANALYGIGIGNL